MSGLLVTPEILRAATLFCDRDFYRPSLVRPWAFREAGQNIVWASDAYTMFVARDIAGRGYRAKPVQIDGEKDATLVRWKQCLKPIRAKRRADEPVAINPKYHARVMRAARILDLKLTAMSVGAPGDVVTYTLGPDAWACVMPMHETEQPVMPHWLRKMVS